MTKNTTGQLVSEPNGSGTQSDINTPDGMTIATAGNDNARRLAACWNACEGSEVEDLERLGADFIKPLIDLIDENEKLKKQAKENRDNARAMIADEMKRTGECLALRESKADLLAALQFCYDWFENDSHITEACASPMQRARAAIAKATGAA